MDRVTCQRYETAFEALVKNAQEKGELRELMTALASTLQKQFHRPTTGASITRHRFNFDLIMRAVLVALRDGDQSEGSRRYIIENSKLGVDGLAKQWKIAV